MDRYRAVEILNKNKHRDSDQWFVSNDLHKLVSSDTIIKSGEVKFITFTEMEASAIAREYLRQESEKALDEGSGKHPFAKQLGL